MMVGTLRFAHPTNELICLPRKRNSMLRSATNWHDGQITSDFPKLCQAGD
jgi:hypothetical protein